MDLEVNVLNVTISKEEREIKVLIIKGHIVIMTILSAEEVILKEIIDRVLKKKKAISFVQCAGNLILLTEIIVENAEKEKIKI